AARYKRAALDNVAALAALARRHLPELGDHADQLCAQALMVSGAVWTHARPSAAMLAAYAADPQLAALRMDFTTTLEDMLTTLITGTLTRAELGVH
ncbi:TetR/AcrR family transcriptional regulator, partial [Streptomyces olivaceoviridis]